VLTFVSIFYSLLPYVVTVAFFYLAVLRKLFFMLGSLQIALSWLLNEFIFKRILLQPRPLGSCVKR
jgi:hypothetical protein